MIMPEDMLEDAGRLAALRDAARRLLAQTEPALDNLERLADQARALAQSIDQPVADAAQQLELRLLGAILAGRAALLVRLAQELQRLARWLPPDQPEQN
jgi:hypothetical protein